MIPVIMMSRSNPRVMIAYVIVDFLVLGVVGALTIRFMRRLKARLRLAKGALCPDCGYDIRGLAETGDCPECGRPFERKADVAYWRRHVSF
jgi:predicted amidophosphoribosyltransferase